MKWIADFRDPWTEIDYFHQLPLSKKAIKKHHYLERKVLTLADTVLVVGNTMKTKYLKFSENIETITNGFDGEISSGKVTLDSKFTITHIGLMNADRNPKMLWEVLSEIISENKEFTKDFELRLVGSIDTAVLGKIKKYKLTTNVNVIKYLPHNKVIDFQRKSQVLLLVVNNVPSAKGILTGKIFEYLMVKRPVLAIAPKNGDLAEIIERTKSGVVIDFNDSELLKKSILEFYSVFKEKKLQINSIDIMQYHRKELAKKVSDIINKITE